MVLTQLKEEILVEQNPQQALNWRLILRRT